MTYAEMTRSAEQTAASVAQIALCSYRAGDDYVLTQADLDEVRAILSTESHPSQPAGEIIRAMSAHLVD